MDQFPHYHILAEITSQRDTQMVMISFGVWIALAFIYLAKGWFQNQLKTLRVAFVVAYFVTALLLLRWS